MLTQNTAENRLLIFQKLTENSPKAQVSQTVGILFSEGQKYFLNQIFLKVDVISKFY